MARGALKTPAGWGYGDIGLALGQDSEPRLLTHDESSLVLSTREILWLDKFSLSAHHGPMTLLPPDMSALKLLVRPLSQAQSSCLRHRA